MAPTSLSTPYSTPTTPHDRCHTQVRVPDQYDKRWSQASLSDGVLRLSYAIDADEVDVPLGN